MVHSFEGEASGHGSVTDDSHCLPVGLALIFRSHCHSKSRADGSGGMAYSEGIVFALRPFGETTQSIVFTVAGKLFPPAGQDLMAIGLMADVPYQLVIRCIEHIMKRHCQF